MRAISSSVMKAPWIALQLRAAGAAEEHVALTEQRLGPALVEDHPRVGLRGDGEGDPRGDVDLDRAGDDVGRGPLRRQHQVDPGRARLLRQADDRVLDFGRGDHHQVRELVDHAEDVRQRRVAVLLAVAVELAEVAAAGLAHDPVAGLHLADQVGEDVGGQARRGDHRRQQVRHVLVVVELDLLRVDQDQADLVRRGLHQDRGEDRVDAARTCPSRWCRRRARAASSPGRSSGRCVNSMLSSILLQAYPNEVRMVLVDPKTVELNHYEDIPHLLTPVVTTPRIAANVLSNLIGEMEARYGIVSARCRNIVELNRSASARASRLPHILCVIDELADLMMVAPGEVEDSIIRLAQNSRAVGIHLVLATQRPSADIITGTIKVNVPARIAFAVSSQTDSRVILDQGGAESLLGQGRHALTRHRLLAPAAGPGALHRRGGDRADHDSGARQGEPEIREPSCWRRPRSRRTKGTRPTSTPKPTTCCRRRSRLVVQTGTAASVSMLQRRLRVGYTSRSADRHDRAPRGDLRLRGLEGATGADHPSRPAPGVGAAVRAAPRPHGRRDRRHDRSVTRRPAACAHGRRADDRPWRDPSRGADEARVDIAERGGQHEDPGQATCGRSRPRSWISSPGPTYVRTFLRTYAEYLGLDPHLLVEEYRSRYPGRPKHEPMTPFPPTRRAGLGTRVACAARPGRPAGSAPCSRGLAGALILVFLIVGVFAGRNSPRYEPSTIAPRGPQTSIGTVRGSPRTSRKRPTGGAHDHP